MTVLCNNCGSTLTTEVNFCPKCGTPTPSYYSHSGSSQVDPTAIPNSTDSISQQASTDHRSLPDGMSDKNPYEQFNPYGITPPPPPRKVRSSLIVGIISGITASLLVLGIVGTFLLFVLEGKNAPVGPFPSPIGSCERGFSDEFNGSLNSQWRWIDPSGNAGHDITSQNHLRISAPGNNDLYPLTNYNAPRLLQPISGNFTIQTLVELSASYYYQGAGILIWQDESNFIRLERAYNHQEGILFEKVEKGILSDISPLASHLTGATRVELRIQRNGDHLIATWREPAQEWQFDGETTIHFDNAMAGLTLVAQHYDQGIPQTTAIAYYDYFRVSCA